MLGQIRGKPRDSIGSFGFQLASTVASIEPMAQEDERRDQIHIEALEVFAQAR
jgi:hypothetical protein